jgi:hypothetical protein
MTRQYHAIFLRIRAGIDTLQLSLTTAFDRGDLASLDAGGLKLPGHPECVEPNLEKV